MNKFIVTTTINAPTKATLLFCKKNDWKFIIVGDLKTPHESYFSLEKKYPWVTYLSPELQEKRYKKLSDLIGWKTIQRRNIGFLYAYHEGADVVATVDDDNIPYENWGDSLLVGTTASVSTFEAVNGVFDPLSVTKNNHLWHRGYPIELLETRREIKHLGNMPRKVLIQADLWDGDPDVDAIARLTFKPYINYDEIKLPYCSSSVSPFNSQNTFLAREVIPFYAVLPFIGRMDDIWGGYILQHYFPDSLVYNCATVVQERNVQDLVKNLEDEIIGYRQTLNLIKNIKEFENFLPDTTRHFYEVYRNSFV